VLNGTPRWLAERRAARAASPTDDSGFTLVEIVVAMTVLMVLASAVGITLINGLGVSKDSRQRVAAANLAARELEIVRNQFSSSADAALAVANMGNVSNANPIAAAGPSVLDGTAYTVQRDVQWLPIGNGASACDGGSLVEHPSLRVKVSVTWPHMRTTRPVVSETLLTPPKGVLDDDTLTFIAVKVTNAAGTGSTGVPLTVSGPGGTFSHTTDGSGCAVFQVGAAGTSTNPYTAVADVAGWVGNAGQQHAVYSPIIVSGGTLARVSMTYDHMASLDVSFGTDAGYGLPSPTPSINYTQPNVPAIGSRRTVPATGTTTTVTGLWPTKNGYSPWGGSCTDSDPAGSPTFGQRVAPVVAAPGGSASVVVFLAPVDILVTDASGQPKAGSTVTATSLSCSGSPADQVLTLGTTDATGHVKSSVPYGRWQLYADNHGNGPDASGGPFQPQASGVTTFVLGGS
jgi:prepilin-type N-terminal cleavage/methylation domain-containing protein